MKTSGKTSLVFDELPSTLDAYKHFLSKRKGLSQAGEPLPELTAALKDYAPDRQKIAAYMRTCGIPPSIPQALPLLYPQVLAGPLHSQLLAHPDFPLQAAGLIHVGNTITQHRLIMAHEVLSLHVSLRGTRPARKGHEFDMLTRALIKEECVWEATTTILSPAALSPEPEGTSRRSFAPISPPYVRSASVRVPEDQGRRYGKVSGDFNPIHLHALSAKLFGFKRAIAHGMWTLARCVAEVHDDVPADGRVHLDVAFKRPVFLPSSFLLNATKDARGCVAMEARAPRGDTLHLAATLTPLGVHQAKSEEE